MKGKPGRRQSARPHVDWCGGLRGKPPLSPREGKSPARVLKSRPYSYIASIRHERGADSRKPMRHCCVLGLVFGVSLTACSSGPAGASSTGRGGDGAAAAGEGHESDASDGQGKAEVGVSGGTLSQLLFAVVGDTRPPTLDDVSGYPTSQITKIYQDIAALQSDSRVRPRHGRLSVRVDPFGQHGASAACDLCPGAGGIPGPVLSHDGQP